MEKPIYKLGYVNDLPPYFFASDPGKKGGRQKRKSSPGEILLMMIASPPTPLQSLEKCLAEISPLNSSLVKKAMQRIDSLAKPQGSLGRLEELAAKLFAIKCGQVPLSAGPARVVTIAADHGVAAHGVSATPVPVTRLQVRNFLRGKGGISVLTMCNGIEHQIVDVGMLGDDLPGYPKLIRKKIRQGSRDISQGPAMTHEECLAALDVGIDLARQAQRDGIQALGVGEMGIGNTTPSTAIFAALYGLDPAAIVGPGAGLPKEKLQYKTRIIKKALAANAQAVASGKAFEILSSLGGLEIAALSGLMLGAAACRIPLMLDGFISTAAYAVALAMAPSLKGYCFFGHASAEPGHAIIMEHLGERALLQLDLRLGEGTGAALALVVLRSAAAMYNDMATLEEAGIGEEAGSGAQA